MLSGNAKLYLEVSSDVGVSLHIAVVVVVVIFAKIHGGGGGVGDGATDELGLVDAYASSRPLILADRSLVSLSRSLRRHHRREGGWACRSLRRFVLESHLLSCSVPLISVASRFELMCSERVGRCTIAQKGERVSDWSGCTRFGNSGVKEQVCVQIRFSS